MVKRYPNPCRLGPRFRSGLPVGARSSTHPTDLPRLLTNSFLHLPGFNVDDEEDLWAAGVKDWSGALSSDHVDVQQKKALRRSISALNKRDSVYFGEKYRPGERWRLLPDFADETAFLDPIFEQLELGQSPGERVAERWDSEWERSPQRLIDYARY